MAQRLTRLLIVYNADSGAVNAVLHALHKTLRPDTYPCSLCALTYGTVSMHGKWKRFLGSLPLDVVFFHKDDFAASFPETQPDLPALLIVQGEAAPEVLISADELDETDVLEGLMSQVKERLVERLGASMLAA